MYKYILERAGDFDFLATVPLVLFVVFFTAVTIRAIRKDKKFVDRMSQLPLDDSM